MSKISVCIATYNGAEFILEQLRSILSQLRSWDELIISDDSSNDDTVALIKALNDSRIKIFEQQTFRSPIFNFENAIRAAEGDFIFLADQDDLWLPQKVEKCLYYLQEYDVVMSDCKIVDSRLNVINESFFKINNSKPGVIRNLIKNSYIGCCLAFRKEMLPLLLPFPEAIPMHDIWIGFVSELSGRVKFIEEPLMLYRRHGRNETASGGTSPFSFRKKLLFRWNTIKYWPLVIHRKKLLSKKM